MVERLNPLQNRADDPATLIFWLYNTTIWLHLMRCDKAVNETLEMLGSFTLIEEILNSDFGKPNVRVEPCHD